MVASEWYLQGDGQHAPALWVWLVRCHMCGASLRVEAFPPAGEKPLCYRCRLALLVSGEVQP